MPLTGGYVTFKPGARSAWNTHPTEQYLVVMAGTGWTQQWGGPIVELHEGDVLWCPPGVKHWHGATPTTSMTHMALTGTVDDKNVDWMEQVSGYLIGFSLGQLMCGALGDRYGRCLSIAIGVLLFIIGSAGCGLSNSVGGLIAWRAV